MKLLVSKSSIFWVYNNNNNSKHIKWLKQIRLTSELLPWLIKQMCVKSEQTKEKKTKEETLFFLILFVWQKY